MTRKSLGILFAVIATTAPVFGQENDQVKVRLVNALPQSPAVSVTVGGTSLFSDVASNKITAYKPMPQQDDQTIKINLADGRELKTTEQFSFDDGDELYTILVTPSESGANPKVVLLEGDDDDADDADQDEAEVTLINASPQHKSVKLRLNDDVEERGVNYSDSGDTDVDPGTYTLAVIGSEGMDNIIATRSVTLTGGAAVTVLLTGENTVKIVNDASPGMDMSTAATGVAGAAAATATTTGTQKHTTGSATGMMPGMDMDSHSM